MATSITTSYDHARATSSAADLLLRIGDGEPAAWDEIHRQHEKLVSAMVRSFRLQEADALDAVQMTWLRLAENAHRIQFPGQLGAWLATTARRECLRIVRQANPVASGAIGMAPETVADPSMGPEQRVIDADTSRTLWKLVAELSPRRRTLLQTLFTDNPRSYAEVAAAAGIPPGGIGPTPSAGSSAAAAQAQRSRVGLPLVHALARPADRRDIN